MAVTEDHGVGGVGHREEEGEGGAERGGDEDEEGVHLDGLRLETHTHTHNVPWKPRHWDQQRAARTYQSREDGQEDGDGRRVTGHLRNRGDHDAGNGDGGQDGKITKRFEKVSNPLRQT